MEVEGNDDSSWQQRRRAVCSKCDRPTTVCLCHVIPPTPLPTKTRIIILQHPHESRHKLNTVPLLAKSLSNLTVITTRRLTAQPNHPTYYLFPPTPSSPAVTLSSLQQSLRKESPLVLIVFDATWKHAREMVKASEGYLGKRVCLDGYSREVEGGSIYDSELLLRKEPSAGCVSTLEAVARWLAAVEDNGSFIEAQLISLLKEMVKLQAQFLKPIKPRDRFNDGKSTSTS